MQDPDVDEKDRVGEVSELRKPTINEFNKVYREIEDTLKTEKDTNFVIIQLFACHGIHHKGTQYVALNELDKEIKTFYKLFPAETKTRDFANQFQNTYMISIFACCRELPEDSWGLNKQREHHMKK